MTSSFPPSPKRGATNTRRDTPLLTSLLIIVVGELSLDGLGNLDARNDEMVLSLSGGVGTEEESVDGVGCIGRSGEVSEGEMGGRTTRVSSRS